MQRIITDKPQVNISSVEIFVFISTLPTTTHFWKRVASSYCRILGPEFSMTLAFWKRWKISPGSKEGELISFHISSSLVLMGGSLRQDFLLKLGKSEDFVNNTDLPGLTFCTSF